VAHISAESITGLVGTIAEKTNWVPHFSRSLREVGSRVVGSGVGWFSRGWRSDLHLENLPIIHHHRTGLAEGVSAVTTPAPEFWRRHQSALDRITVDVAQFLGPLAARPDIEVVETLLPDVLRRALEEFGLRGVVATGHLDQNAPRKAKLQSLHDG